MGEYFNISGKTDIEFQRKFMHKPELKIHFLETKHTVNCLFLDCDIFDENEYCDAPSHDIGNHFYGIHVVKHALHVF